MIKLSIHTELDLKKLIATRMLINANSGGGKSWLLRRFLERSHGQVQQLIIDLEGEFSTLREKYDYLLVGKDGEVPIHIRTAEMLAKKLLELNVSTILDLSELRHPERITFVKRFLDSLVNSPKNLWHPVIVVVDEAHQFCPESSKSESASAVIDLMTRGRKRGFCGVLATQRISKLNKDAAAEANNYLVGRTGLDIDMKRAGDLLGFTTKEDIRSLRDLQAGEFYMFGPAFQHTGLKKDSVGDVQTTHPDRTRGTEISKPIETPANIQRILKDVVDLPKEADEELRTVDDLKRKVKELKAKLTISERHQPAVDPRAIENARAAGIEQGLREGTKEVRALEQKIEAIAKIVGQPVLKAPPQPIAKKQDTAPPPVPNKPPSEPVLNGNLPLRAGAMRMLNWLAGATMLTKQRLATLSGFSVKGGTFNTYLSELKRNGWVVGDTELSITEEGLRNAEPQEIPSGEELLSMWMGKFRAGAGKILEHLYEQYPNSIGKYDLGYAVGFEPTGGTFGTYLSELRRNNLISIEGDMIAISEEFFG